METSPSSTSKSTPEDEAFEPRLYEDPDLVKAAETDTQLADRLRALQLADELLEQNPGDQRYATMHKGMHEAVLGYATQVGYRWGEQPEQGDS